MSDNWKRKKNLQRKAKLLSRLIVAVVGILLLIALCLRIYLSSALPAPQLSRFMTSYLHQGFTVESLHTSGGTLFLKGVHLKNPEGFPQGSLAAADSVAIAPEWRALLAGQLRFRLIALEGIKVSLDKNSRELWNFSQLQQLLAARKPSTTGTYIKELIVKDGAFKVQGEGVQGVALQVFNLTTKGSLDSKVELAFEDAGHNRYTLKGKVRAGSDEALDLTLTAPSLSLKEAAVILKLKHPGMFEGAQGTLQVNVSLHKGKLSTSGDFSFSEVRLAADEENYPWSGMLHFAADYSIKNDTARLLSCTLTVDKLVKLHATGNARGLKHEREFALYLGMDEVDLGAFNVMVPEELRKHLLFGGRLRCDSLHLVGNGKGLKSAIGTLILHDGALTRESQLVVAGLSGTIGVSRKDAAIHAQGRLSLSGPHDKALLEALDIPFGLTVSSQLKPLWAEIPALFARVMGSTINGRLAFDAKNANPLTASLKLSAAKLSALNPLLRHYDLQAAAGTASATLEVTGKSAKELSATAKLQLLDVRGSREKDSFAVGKGSVTTFVQRKDGQLQAKGDAQLSALAFNGKAADARFGYRVADSMVYLDGARVTVGGTQLSISRLSARIPPKQTAAKIARYPLALDVGGCAIKQREVELTDLSGRMRGSFNTDSAGRWLEGTADLASSRVIFQGKAVAAPVVRAAFSRSGGRGELGGQFLGGKLAGTVSFQPFAPEAGATFELSLTGARLAAAAPLVPKASAVHPAGGLVDLHLKGGYSRRDGIACRLESKGGGIVLAGSGGKTFVSGAGISLTGEMAGDDLFISSAVLSPGPGVVLNLKGKLVQPFSPKRKGSLAFSLPETALNGVVDPFVNMLPRLIQEATVDGTVAADGKIELYEGKKLLEGALIFKGGRMEVAAQKLVAADINGRLPFSLDLSGKTGGKPQDVRVFSRDNYPRLLEQLRLSAGGQVVTVGKIGFGALELGKLTLHVSAGNGITEITSLNSSLYQGALLGKGHVTMREKLSYRGDLLINGLSLRALCSVFPAIKGYISGRVDGVISLSGGGKGLAGITGFTDLWAREAPGEKMLVSKEFLQRLSKQKLSGFFFRSDRPYDQAEITGMLEEGDLSFKTLKIVHTNLFGVRDLSVSMAPTQNRIALEHLLESIKEAAVRGKPVAGEQPAGAPVTPEFKWGE